MALPIMTVDNMEDAETMKILVGAKAYDADLWRLTRESGFQFGKVDTLIVAGQWIEMKYKMMKRRRELNGERKH